jgi:hypothetical protein
MHFQFEKILLLQKMGVTIQLVSYQTVSPNMQLET